MLKCVAWLCPRCRLTYRLPRCIDIRSATVPAAHRRLDQGVAELDL